jgi:hypothetical protein
VNRTAAVADDRGARAWSVPSTSVVSFLRAASARHPTSHAQGHRRRTPRLVPSP